MQTPWIEENRLEKVLTRNEAFWKGELDEGPLLWLSVKPAAATNLPEPASEEELWTNPSYVIESTENRLAHTTFLGDALPVHCPWLGPDQFAGWLGADLVLAPRTHNTSWAVPFLDEWNDPPFFRRKAGVRRETPEPPDLAPRGAGPCRGCGDR